MASGKTKLSPRQPGRIELSHKKVFPFLLIGSVMSLSVLALKNYLLVVWGFLQLFFFLLKNKSYKKLEVVLNCKIHIWGEYFSGAKGRFSFRLV